MIFIAAIISKFALFSPAKDPVVLIFGLALASVAWLLVMSWDLSSNWRTELARLRMTAKVGPQRAAELLPPYPGDVAAALPDFKALYAEIEARLHEAVAQVK